MPYVLVDNNFTQTGVDNTPLGVGVDFTQDQLFLSITTDREQALQNLKNLLLTRVGERFGLPTFGCDLLTILFQPNLNILKDQIRNLITAPIQYWLPYINILDIIITTNEDNPDLENEIEIEIVFSIDDVTGTTQTIGINVNNGNITTNP